MRDHVGCASEDNLNAEECRCDEEEGELDRLRDTREHRSKGCGEQQALGRRLLRRLRTAVHGERCTRQAEDHEDELTGEVARRVSAEVRDIRRGELREEDVLAALDELAVNHHRTADARLPERQVEDVVQAERDQGALDDAEDQRADVARARDEAAEREDALLCQRPDEVEADADEEVDDCRDNRHEARAAEERQRVRQHDLVELIVEVRDADTDDDAAEDAHLVRHDAAGARDRALEHARRNGAVRQDLAVELEHGIAGAVHDKEGDHGRESRDLALRLGHADGDADCEDDRQVAEDRAARAGHDGQKTAEKRAIAKDGFETIRLDRRRVGERRADTEQDTGNRQHSDRQHEAAADALQYAEDFVFHETVLSRRVQAQKRHQQKATTKIPFL